MTSLMWICRVTIPSAIFNYSPAEYRQRLFRINLPQYRVHQNVTED